jgi:hypothetical protein
LFGVFVQQAELVEASQVVVGDFSVGHAVEASAGRGVNGGGRYAFG